MPSLPSDTFSSLHIYVRSLPKHFDHLSEFLLTLNRSSSVIAVLIRIIDLPCYHKVFVQKERTWIISSSLIMQNRNHHLSFFSSLASIHGLCIWAFFFGFHGECWMWKNSLYDINLADASTRERNPNGFLALPFWNNVVTVRNNIVTMLQPCVALKNNVVTVRNNIVTMLQPCVALKIVGANRLV